MSSSLTPLPDVLVDALAANDQDPLRAAESMLDVKQYETAQIPPTDKRSNP